ncbi:MAG: ABC-2 family transporter protein [Candidatus Doudnabacteria bacterium]|nr:ABC-2 family transporter protein [Candidatus Doudnabacteria bacterium]
MRRYLRIYWHMVKQNINRDLQFRSDFWLAVATQLAWFGMQILFFRILFNQTVEINGWSFEHILVLLAVFLLIEMVVIGLFMHNFARMPSYISDGELDFLLLKPVDAQFLSSLRYFSTNSLFNILPPLLLLFVGFGSLGITAGLGQILLFAVGFVSSVVILYSLWFITVISLFWINKVFEIHEFFLSLFHFVKYPSSIYRGFVKHFFSFVFPIILTVTVPAQILLSTLENTAKLLWLPLIAAITFALSRLIWKAGLRRYVSASS